MQSNGTVTPLNRVKIYIDGANFLYGLKSLDQKFNDFWIDFLHLGYQLCNDGNLVGINGTEGASLYSETLPECRAGETAGMGRMGL